MEEKIYQRQVIKQSISRRVVDEHQLDRHFTRQELEELYKFEPDTYTGDSEALNVPDDDLFADLILQCKEWILKYHEHDSLLENRVEETLSDADRRAAWAEYETEKSTGARQLIPGLDDLKDEPDTDPFSHLYDAIRSENILTQASAKRAQKMAKKATKAKQAHSNRVNNENANPHAPQVSTRPLASSNIANTYSSIQAAVAAAAAKTANHPPKIADRPTAASVAAPSSSLRLASAQGIQAVLAYLDDDDDPLVDLEL
jgi:hypothetical protein